MLVYEVINDLQRRREELKGEDIKTIHCDEKDGTLQIIMVDKKDKIRELDECMEIRNDKIDQLDKLQYKLCTTSLEEFERQREMVSLGEDINKCQEQLDGIKEWFRKNE